MKKILQLFIIACFVLLNVQLVSAAAQAWTDTNYDFSKAHKLLIVKPNYTFTEGQVTSDELTDMMYQQAQSLDMYALNIADIDKNILRDSSIDLPKLRLEDAQKAESIFNDQMEKYTDLYMVATIIHNTRVMVFYDVYSAATKQPVFTYQIVASSTADDNMVNYRHLTKAFYKEFNKAMKAKK
ncbi:MAG: hypothetical protein H6Q70_2636 [Firmicutes bacterium]|nr:hypothetical protein [Bacillota bacterium]